MKKQIVIVNTEKFEQSYFVIWIQDAIKAYKNYLLENKLSKSDLQKVKKEFIKKFDGKLKSEVSHILSLDSQKFEEKLEFLNKIKDSLESLLALKDYFGKREMLKLKTKSTDFVKRKEDALYL
jgi:hypothetical protein